jgi:hypothetical protein
MSRYSPRAQALRLTCATGACVALLAGMTWNRAARAEAPHALEPGTTARVAIRADYEGAVLELRRFGGYDAWHAACAAPCARQLVVAGMEARVVAPGMTPSKPFRVEPGSGSALLTVNGGSAGRASAGRLSLYVGVPLGFAGMGAFAYGKYDDRTPLVVGGGIALGLGAALVLVALPLIVSGSTEVTNSEGQWIADTTPAIRF